MPREGLLIDYEFCTGCHTCEMACKQEHELPVGKHGIELKQVGPWEIAPGNWQYSYVPIPAELCDLCADRAAVGKEPACVHHCQAQVMVSGSVAELAKTMEDKSHTVLFAPR